MAAGRREPGPAGVAGSAAETAVRAWLRAFRSRALAARLLRLCFLAVLLNEAERLLAFAARVLLHTSFPVVGIGPLFIAGMYVVLRRRWSTPVTAARADAALGLRDRLLSFTDFARRPDVDPSLREAQARETAGVLGAASVRQAAPLPLFLAAGPLLLLASVAWPLFAFRSGAGPPRFFPGYGARHYAGPVDTAPTPAPGHRGGEAGREAEEEAAKKGDASEREKGLPPPDRRLPALPEGRTTEPKEGDPARTPTKNAPEQVESALKSFPVGERLSPVVDPLLAQGGGGARHTEPPRGLMAFRLFPRGGKGAGVGSAVPAESEAGRVVVDFDAIPERYRPVVEQYFKGLGPGG